MRRRDGRLDSLRRKDKDLFKVEKGKRKIEIRGAYQDVFERKDRKEGSRKPG